MNKGFDITRMSRATTKAFDRVDKATVTPTTDKDLELMSYMKLTPEKFSALVSEFGISVVEPYIREMEMKKLRKAGQNG